MIARSLDQERRIPSMTLGAFFPLDQSITVKLKCSVIGWSVNGKPEAFEASTLGSNPSRPFLKRARWNDARVVPVI